MEGNFYFYFSTEQYGQMDKWACPNEHVSVSGIEVGIGKGDLVFRPPTEKCIYVYDLELVVVVEWEREHNYGYILIV